MWGQAATERDRGGEGQRGAAEQQAGAGRQVERREGRQPQGHGETG
jgi:hypothetical protein